MASTPLVWLLFGRSSPHVFVRLFVEGVFICLDASFTFGVSFVALAQLGVLVFLTYRWCSFLLLLNHLKLVLFHLLKLDLLPLKQFLTVGGEIQHLFTVLVVEMALLAQWIDSLIISPHRLVTSSILLICASRTIENHGFSRNANSSRLPFITSALQNLGNTDTQVLLCYFT